MTTFVAVIRTRDVQRDLVLCVVQSSCVETFVVNSRVVPWVEVGRLTFALYVRQYVFKLYPQDRYDNAGDVVFSNFIVASGVVPVRGALFKEFSFKR